MELKDAVIKLKEELKKDEGYYYSWQANIAMAFKDEYIRKMGGTSSNVHDIANQAARNFLDLLISQ